MGESRKSCKRVGEIFKFITMKTKIILFLALALVGFNVQAQNPLQKNIDQSNWKTYTNNKLGFTFQHPSAWINKGKDIEVVNLSGTIKAIEINFTDTIFKTTLLVTYHLAPYGAELYRYAVSQYDSTRCGKQIEVAGNNAIETITTISIDGKGHTLNPPLRLIVIYFLDKKQTGEIELQFKTPLSNHDIEVSKFKQLLSTFKF